MIELGTCTIDTRYECKILVGHDPQWFRRQVKYAVKSRGSGVGSTIRYSYSCSFGVFES